MRKQNIIIYGIHVLWYMLQYSMVYVILWYMLYYGICYIWYTCIMVYVILWYM